MIDAQDVLIKPVLSEKATDLREKGVYVFKVDSRANKRCIKAVVEKLFDVKVINLKVMNVRGRERRRGAVVGKSGDWKKALVTLKAGQKIGIFEGA